MNILTNLDLNKNQLLNAVIQQLSVAPSNPSKGQLYFSTQSNTLQIFNGVEWTDVGSGKIPELNIGNVTGLQAVLDDKVGNARVLTDVPVNAKFTDTIVTKASLGLGDVDNTTDLNKPVSTATRALIDAKESIANVGTKVEGALTSAKTYTDTEISKLVGDGVSTALDTLKELADALGNDPNFATTVMTQLGLKANKYKETIGNGVLTSFTITHGLNSRDVIVQVRQVGSPYEIVYTDVNLDTLNTAVIKFAVKPALNEYSVTVIG